MIRLLALGSLDLLADDGRSLDPVLRQPKRAALLAYLAAARPRGFQRRDRLHALFWPETDGRHARAALNSALRFLRRWAGDDAIASRGDAEVGLHPGRVWSDVRAFDDALARGRPADALSLYGGDLLLGFHAAASPEFDDWAEAERRRMRLAAMRGARALADDAARSGDVEGAVAWARRAEELEPENEAVVRRLAELLALAGDRVGALRVCHAHTARLTRELRIAPSLAVTALAERLRTDDGAFAGAERRGP